MKSILKRLAALITALLIGSSLQAAESFDIIEADIGTIHAAYKAGTLSAEQLTSAYLDRIEAFDKKGPKLNSFITVNPKALEVARSLDKERKSKGLRGPLHGIPIVIKDNYDTKDLPTTGGSAALKEHQPQKDAFTVKQLRAAGAIILGKTNLSELALSYGRLGYSSQGGLTLNPYNLKRDASGSSSGTGAAVGGNLAVLGTGTDTAGSIRGPAAVTGNVGIKPTLGLTSRSGVIPASLSLDVTGPIARTVHDAAVALTVMAGVDQEDSRTKASAEFQVKDYRDFLNAKALKGKRLGVVTTYTGANPEVDVVFDRALSLLRKQGAETVDVAVPELIQDAWSSMMGPVVDNEFDDQIEFYFRQSNAPVRTVEELIAVSLSPGIQNSDNPVNPGRIDGYRAAAESLGLADQVYIEILTMRMPKARKLVIDLMKEKELDALVFPTMLCPASPLFNLEDKTYVCDAPDPYIPSYLASSTGFPEITVPMGYTKQGLPLGISFFATPYKEPRLIGLAFAYEQASKWRRAAASTVD
jgi:amidase